VVRGSPLGAAAGDEGRLEQHPRLRWGPTGQRVVEQHEHLLGDGVERLGDAGEVVHGGGLRAVEADDADVEPGPQPGGEQLVVHPEGEDVGMTRWTPDPTFYPSPRDAAGARGDAWRERVTEHEHPTVFGWMVGVRTSRGGRKLHG